MPEKLSEEEVLELIKRMRQGHQSARDELIIAYSGIPYKLARKYCQGDGRLCDELATVGYIALIKLVDGSEFDQTRFKTCVYVRVSSRMFDHLRKKKAEISFRHESLDTSPREDDDDPVKELASATLTPEEEFLCKESLSDALGELSEIERKVVTMHYLEGRSVAEIAEELKMPMNTVKSHLRRAREKLLRLLPVSLANRPGKSQNGGKTK